MHRVTAGFPARHLGALVVLSVASSLLSTRAPAQEWTRFRGPNGTGECEVTLPAEFTGNAIRWRIKLPGIGHASPVIWGEKVFVLSADPESAQRNCLCIDFAGKVVWDRSYPSTPHHLHQRNSYASSTPACDEERVYFCWSTPTETTILALDHEGHERWRKDLGPGTFEHGFGTSPIIYGDLLILFNSQQSEQLRAGEKPGDSFMMAFDRKTGEERWRTPRKSIRVIYSVPFIWRNPAGKDELVCTSQAEGIFSLDPQTGEPLWQNGTFTMRTVSSPVAVGGMIFGSAGSGGGGNHVVAVKPGKDGAEAYRIDKMAPYVPSLVARGDLLFLFGDKGVLSCVDAKTGESYWQQRVDGAAFSGSPIRAGDKLYCIDESGTLVCVAASKEYQLLGRTPLGEPSRATPAVSGGRMFLRTQSQLICVGGPST